jgi:hypothetical protein
MESSESDNNFTDNPNKTSKKSSIYKILKKKDRTYASLKKLNSILKKRDIDCNAKDPLIDGSYLHFLTQTAKTNDEYNHNSFKLFKFNFNFISFKVSHGEWCMLFQMLV